MTTISKRSLTPAQRWLLKRMQQIQFGRLLWVEFRHGQPVLDPAPRAKRRFKFGGRNGVHPKLKLEDFALKKEVVELFEHMERKQNGVIDFLTIRYGVPFEMDYDDD